MFTDKLNESFRQVADSKKSFFSDSYNYTSLGIAGLLNIIHWVILFSKIKPSRTTVLLHYNVVYGPDFVEKSIYLYWVPLLALMLLLLNIFVASEFYKREKLASYFLSISTVVIQLIFFIATLVLIFANAQ